jgi:hypothetical protein
LLNEDMLIFSETYEHPTQVSKVRINVYEEPPMPNPPGIDTPTTGGGYLVTEERIGTTKVIATLGFFDRKEDALARARRRVEELKAQRYQPLSAAA